MIADYREAYGSDAAATRAVGISAKLAWDDLCFKVRGKRVSSLGEDALFGRRGRFRELPNGSLRHVEFGKKQPQA